MKFHSFNTEFAKSFGIETSVIMSHLCYWCQFNKANGTNLRDGDYWTYISLPALQELFPYMTMYSIRKSLQTLEEKGLIKKGNYNEKQYDRTLWYSVTDYGFVEYGERNRQMDVSKSTDGCVGNERPIPNTKPYKETDNNSNSIVSSSSEDSLRIEFSEIWSIYPRKVGAKKAFEYYKRARKNGVAMSVIKDGVEKYRQQVIHDRTESNYIKHGSTWFNSEGWNDDYSFKSTGDIGTQSNEEIEESDKGRETIW